MITFDEVFKQLDQDREAQESFAISEDDEDIAADVVSLAACFAIRPDVEAVEVWHDGQPKGRLGRSDFFKMPGVADLLIGKNLARGVGAGDSLSLPGDLDEALIVLCCPIDNCDHRIYARRYNPDDAPDCPNHPGTKVVPCAER
jgi:hypothetical protein